jgi:subtilisin family serine protease
MPPSPAPVTPLPARAEHPKLDGRFAILYEKAPAELAALVDQEHDRLQVAQLHIRNLLKDLKAATTDTARAGFRADLKRAYASIPIPLTTGVHLPKPAGSHDSWLPDFGEISFSVLILSDVSAHDLTALGAVIRSQFRDIFTAFVPRSRLAGLESSPVVQMIELARPLKSSLEWSMDFTQMDDLHAVTPSPEDGAGIIIGVIDRELDFYHPEFRDPVTDETRILFLWDQNLDPEDPSEKGPPRPKFSPFLDATAQFLPFGSTGPTVTQFGGVEYDSSAINAAIHTRANNISAGIPPNSYGKVRHDASIGDGHGTKVTGCAAGNGRSSAGVFVGAAPKADIIFVGFKGLFESFLLTDTNCVVDAFRYIFARAEQLQQRPCVVNLSYNDNSGPHDGDTLGEQALDDLLGQDRRAITVSAGNWNEKNLHAHGTVPAGDPLLLVLNLNSAYGRKNDKIEIWYNGAETLKASISVPDVTESISGTGGDVLDKGFGIDILSQKSELLTGDNVITLTIRMSDTSTVQGPWTIALTGNVAGPVEVEAWIHSEGGLFQWAAPEKDRLTIAAPATARNVIAVGAHTKDQNDPAHVQLAGYSGCGRTRVSPSSTTGRIKPEIVSVGGLLIGAGPLEDEMMTIPLNRNMNALPLSTVFNTLDTGTSLSAPLVAGACALLFQCCGPDLSWSELLYSLKQTSGHAWATVPAPPVNGCGHGYLLMNTGCLVSLGYLVPHVYPAPPELQLKFDMPTFWESGSLEIADSFGKPQPDPFHDPSASGETRVRVTVLNRRSEPIHGGSVELYWAEAGTNLSFGTAWKREGIRPGDRDSRGGTNVVALPTLEPGRSTLVEFVFSAPARRDGTSDLRLFSLLARVKNPADRTTLADPEGLGYPTQFYCAMRNTIVREIPARTGSRSGARDAAGAGTTVASGSAPDFALPFDVHGTADRDRLTVQVGGMRGEVTLELPIQALPWRDISVLQPLRAPRAPYGSGVAGRSGVAGDPLIDVSLTLERGAITARTDITGAERLELRGGRVRIVAAREGVLVIPSLRIARGTPLPVRLEIRDPQLLESHGLVRVAQYSAGQLTGGLTLELRPRPGVFARGWNRLRSFTARIFRRLRGNPG